MELQEEFVRDITALEESGAGMPFIFTPAQAFMLLATLQVAMRHPRFNDAGPTTEFISSLADNIEERLCVTPALKELARRGRDPQYDG